MGELIKTAGGAVATPQQTAAAAQIMAVCRVVTPQFYKGLTDTDLKAEKSAIELLTAHIDAAVMSKMCELAVQNYGTARSDNNRVYFDVNYVLNFYRAAFNSVWCDNVELPKGAERGGDDYDPTSRMITEYWHSKDGKEYTVKYIAEADYNDVLKRHNGMRRHYTPKFYEREQEQRNEWLNDPNFEI